LGLRQKTHGMRREQDLPTKTAATNGLAEVPPLEQAMIALTANAESARRTALGSRPWRDTSCSPPPSCSARWRWNGCSATATGKSAVSRRFVKAAEIALAKLMAADLTDLDLVAAYHAGSALDADCVPRWNARSRRLSPPPATTTP